MTIAVQLRRDVHDLGRAGQIVNVSQAYARNFLIPKGLAVIATPQVARAAQQQAAQQAAHQTKQQSVETAAKTTLAGARIVVTGRASPAGKLFAAIKTEHILAAIKTQKGVSLSPTVAITPTVLKTTGDHEVTIALAGTPVLLTVHIDHADR